MKPVLLSVSAMLLLGGCTTPHAPPAQGAVPTRDPSTADWMMVEQNENGQHQAFLTFVPRSAMENWRFFMEARLALICPANAQQVEIGFVGVPGVTAITLESGGERLELRNAEAEAQGQFGSERIAVDTPLLQAFARSGAVRMTVNGRTTDLVASARHKGEIARFFHYCKSPWNGRPAYATPVD